MVRSCIALAEYVGPSCLVISVKLAFASAVLCNIADIIGTGYDEFAATEPGSEVRMKPVHMTPTKGMKSPDGHHSHRHPGGDPSPYRTP